MDDINDELFRRAADNYPLKTDTPDWDTVLNKMNTADPSGDTDHAPKKRNKNYRWLLLLLLFIPFAIFENRNSQNNSGNGGEKNTVNTQGTGKEKNDQAEQVSNGSSETKNSKTETTTEDKNIAKNQNSNSVTPVATEPDLKKAIPGIKNNTTDDLTAIATDNTTSASTEIKNNRVNLSSSRQRSKMKIKNALATADDENISGPVGVKENNRKKKQVSRSAASVKLTGTEAENDIASTKEVVTKETVTANEKDIQAEKEKTVTTSIKETEPTKKDTTVTPKAKQTETVIAKPDEKKSTKEEKKKKDHSKHFYAGLIGGPDFSAIKLQSLKKVGLNYGFLIGYKLTKKLSVEAGLLQDKKYYSTNGKYFSTKNIWLPPTETIDHVDGICKMLELPVNITYTFRERKRSSLFGSVGFSSYFMQKETYTYELNYGGYRYPKDYSYKNRSTSLFAMVNISAGYTYKMGKIGDLRIEPFIKLPVNKIGTGELPIQSGGIFIGFTKLIF